MSRTKVLITVLVLLVTVIYLRYYLTYKDDYNILQTYLDRVDINVIYEKYPVVIYDRVKDPSQLLKTLFAYSYVFQRGPTAIPSNRLITNKSKYVILHSGTNDAEIHVLNPKYAQAINNKESLADIAPEANAQYVTIKLRANQVLILPCHWIYQASEPIQSIRLDDVLSAIVSFF